MRWSRASRRGFRGSETTGESGATDCARRCAGSATPSHGGLVYGTWSKAFALSVSGRCTLPGGQLDRAKMEALMSRLPAPL